MKRLFILFFIVLSFPLHGAAQGYAYFYIEGDQQTPFYVKVEGKMQERFGENHFIIPNLDAGYTHFEILFQQNIYPPQDFLLEVPESGYRGFVLHKVNDRQFALYDLQQKRYLVSGNTKEDDHAPDAGFYAAKLPSPEKTAALNGNPGELPKFAPEKENKQKNTSVSRNEPHFLEDIELNAGTPAVALNDEAATALGPEAERAQRKLNRKQKRLEGRDLSTLPALRYDDSMELQVNKDTETAQEDLPPVPNTDCPNAMGNDAFESFALRFIDQSDDNKKLKFLRKNVNRLCFSTEQVRIITKNLDTQSGRYEAVKMLYVQTSDQENYGKLESLFNTPFLKKKFEEIINPPN